MTPSLTAELAKHGLWGMALLTALGVIVALYRENQRLWRERLAEYRTAQERELERANQVTAALTRTTAVLDASTEADGEVREAFIALTAELRGPSAPGRGRGR